MSIQAARNGDYRSRQILEALLVDILRDQDAAGIVPCSEAIDAAIVILGQGNLDPELPPIYMMSLRTLHPGVIRACLRYLMTPRTPEELLRLSLFKEEPLGRCQCSRDYPFESHPFVRDLHALPRGDDDDTSLLRLLRCLVVFTSLCYNFVLNTSNGWTVLKHSRKAMRYGQEHTWPSSHTDLVPFGTEASIAALCAWTQFYPTMELGGFIDLVLQCAGKDTVTGPLVRTLYTALTRILEGILAKPHDEHIQTQSVVKRTLHALALSTPLLECLSDAGSGRLPLAIVQNRDILQPFIPICTRIVRLYFAISGKFPGLLNPMVEGIFFEYVFCAARLHSALGLPDAEMDPLMFVSASKLGLRNQPEKMKRDPALRLISYLRYIHGRGVMCASATCARTALAIEHPLYVCSACRHVYYCSTACQRRAWRDAVAPHRDICPDVRDVMQLLEPVLSSEDLTIRVPIFKQRDDFSQRCKRAGVKPAKMRRVVEYLDLVYQ